MMPLGCPLHSHQSSRKVLKYTEEEISAGKVGSVGLLESLLLTVMLDMLASRQQQLQNNQRLQVVKSETSHSNGDEPMHSYSSANKRTGDETFVEISGSQTAVLRDHEYEIFINALNPTTGLWASGSGGSYARIWNTKKNPSSPTRLILRNCFPKGGTEALSKKDVTYLDLNCDGTPMAMGSFGGCIRTTDDQLISTLDQLKHSQFSGTRSATISSVQELIKPQCIDGVTALTSMYSIRSPHRIGSRMSCSTD